jgi:hypothetical protein
VDAEQPATGVDLPYVLQGLDDGTGGRARGVGLSGVQDLKAHQAGHRRHPAEHAARVERAHRPTREVVVADRRLQSSHVRRTARGRRARDDARDVRSVAVDVDQRAARARVARRGFVADEPGKVPVQPSHGRIGQGTALEMRVVPVDTGVEDRPADAGAAGSVRPARGVGLDRADGAVYLSAQDVVGPDPEDRARPLALRVRDDQAPDLLTGQQASDIGGGDRARRGPGRGVADHLAVRLKKSVARLGHPLLTG